MYSFFKKPSFLLSQELSMTISALKTLVIVEISKINIVSLN